VHGVAYSTADSVESVRRNLKPKEFPKYNLILKI
jgi:hypothetical protein